MNQCPSPVQRHQTGAKSCCSTGLSDQPTLPRESRPASTQRVRASLASRSVAGVLLATVVLPHPGGIADHRSVVRRDALLVRKVVGPFHRRHPATRPLAVVRDQHDGHIADGRARLEETFDASSGTCELGKVLLVRSIRGAHCRRALAARPFHLRTATASEPIHQTHGDSLAYGANNSGDPRRHQDDPGPRSGS